MMSPFGPSDSVTVPIEAPTPVALISLIVTTTCSARDKRGSQQNETH